MEKSATRLVFFILIIFILVIIGCNPNCSGEKIKNGDSQKIEQINSKYTDYKIEIDKCLPQGYVNLYIINSSLGDSLKIENIFNEILNSNITPQRLKIFDSKNKFMYELYNVRDIENNKNKIYKLTIEDL